MRSLLLAAILVVPALAHGRPITVGASLGLTQSEADSQSQPDHALALYGRIGLAQQFSAQLEVSRFDASDRGQGSSDTKSLSAVAVLDLSAHGQLVPILLGGLGIDSSDNTYGSVAAHHVEAGIGLEYRASGGFVIGADARIGLRSIDSSSTSLEPVPIACCVGDWSSPALADGQYRSVRATIGVKF